MKQSQLKNSTTTGGTIHSSGVPALVLWLAVGMGSVFSSDPAPASDPVAVPDPALADALQNILERKGIEKETFGSADLAKIEYLDGRDLGITDLTGLEHCLELREVHLDGNAIKDIRPLSACVQIRILDLAGNELENIDALGTLTELRYLNVENNEIESIACVTKMTELTSLLAGSNRITETSPLQSHTHLHTLFLAGNRVSDISALASDERLSTVDLRGNAIADVSPLKPLKQLRWTFLSDNAIVDIAPLAQMAVADSNKDFARWWRLYLDGNKLADDANQHLQSLAEAGVAVFLESPPAAAATTGTESPE